jgi:hypothetical protein
MEDFQFLGSFVTLQNEYLINLYLSVRIKQLEKG